VAGALPRPLYERPVRALFDILPGGEDHHSLHVWRAALQALQEGLLPADCVPCLPRFRFLESLLSNTDNGQDAPHDSHDPEVHQQMMVSDPGFRWNHWWVGFFVKRGDLVHVVGSTAATGGRCLRLMSQGVI